nr:hypothetical protein [Tanacetum cinerariifolium]
PGCRFRWGIVGKVVGVVGYGGVGRERDGDGFAESGGKFGLCTVHFNVGGRQVEMEMDLYPWDFEAVAG